MSFGGAHVLVVEDDESIRSSLVTLLEAQGYRVSAFADDRGVPDLVAVDRPALVILDRTLPSGDGLELAKWLRDTLDLPIIMVTAAGDPIDRIAGNNAGVDHYFVKPVDLLDLHLAVQALLRRARAPERRVLTVADVVVDLEAHKASRGGKTLELPPKQLAILAALARNAGAVVSKRELLADVWGPGYHDVNLVEAQVTLLRRRLHEAGDAILTTVRGAGYRLETS